MLMRYSDASVELGNPPESLIDSVGGTAAIPNTRQNGKTSSLKHLPVVRLKGVEIHAITAQQCINHILDSLDEGIGGTVVTPNLDIIRRCQNDLVFASLVAESSLVVADGMPLIWASKVQGTPLPQRIAGSDLISTLSVAAAARRKTIFLLGGDDGVAEKAAKVLEAKAPGMQVVGTYCPPFGFDKSETEIQKIISAITSVKPDIIWVALGSPKQEILINRIKNSSPKSWWLGVGISFSFLTGDVQRAPKWIQKIGMEWLHRVMQEPKRLFKRYFVHGLPFAGNMIFSAAGVRLMGKSAEHQNLTAPVRNADTLESPEETLTTDPANESILPGPGEAPDNSTTGQDGFQSGRFHEISMARGLKKLKAIILLGGRVRQSPLSLSIGRSVLDLPLDENGSILNHWASQSSELMQRVGIQSLVVRVMVDQNSHAPTSLDPKYASLVSVERDQSSLRGTGGLIADIAADYADDDLLLVGNATQVLLDPLWAIAAALDHKTGDFTLISHRDGTASGLMLLSCKTVRAIAKAGYIDLKEQALPKIASKHDVRVVHCRQPTGLPLFSFSDYISALQRFHLRKDRRRARNNPLNEETGKKFALIEKGAVVAPDAYLHDAVVLSGATIEPGTAVIRSLVGPNVVLKKGKIVSDQLLGLM